MLRWLHSLTGHNAPPRVPCVYPDTQSERQSMPKRTPYIVRLRQQATGEEHDRLIFALDETTAGERAVVKARIALGTTMVERHYGKFEVLSCTPAETSS